MMNITTNNFQTPKYPTATLPRKAHTTEVLQDTIELTAPALVQGAAPLKSPFNQSQYNSHAIQQLARPADQATSPLTLAVGIGASVLLGAAAASALLVMTPIWIAGELIEEVASKVPAKQAIPGS